MNAPEPYRVEATYPELPDTQTVILRPLSGTLRRYDPGQFAMLSVFGHAEVPISVSRVGDGEVHHTVRSVGTGSDAVTHLRPGDEVGVRGPYGTAWPLQQAEGHDLVILAGGLGLAPLRPVVDHVIAHRDRFNEVALLYGTREPAQLLYPQEYVDWAQSLEFLRIVDHADARWRGPVGVITKLIKSATFDPSDTVAMVCGPEVMMRFCARDLEQSGVARERIFLSLERNMKCAVGLCGHCQFAGHFVCRDGAVLGYDRVAETLWVREL